MLNGWKAIAAHLRRDERTAMRWAAERAMPVHRMPGPGRGSVDAIAGELDAWLEDDRARVAEAARVVPTVIEPAEPPTVTWAPIPWWRRRRAAGALIASGAVLTMLGALTLHRAPVAAAQAEVGFSDPATRAMFLQASYDWNLRTPDSLARAVREYSDAIGRDPRVPSAYVGLANSYLLLREDGALPEADAYTRAEAAARAAVSLSPACADAHRALAFIAFWWQRDTDTARREFARALALKPDDALTHHWLANALLANGEANDALREINRARDLDPLAPAIVADRAAILYFAGNQAEGLADLRQLAHDQPDIVGPHRALAEIALFERRPDEFLHEAALTARLRSDAAGLAAVERWRAAGPSETGIEAAMLSDARRAGNGWFRVARIAAIAGRRDEAKDALARACQAREPAAVSAPADLWLSRVLDPAAIAAQCGETSRLL